MTRAALRARARAILRAGLEAVEPARLVREHLGVEGSKVHAGGAVVGNPHRIFVVSVGKAAIAMMRGARRALGNRITCSIVIAPVAAPAWPRTTSFAARHPVPDRAGLRAGRSVIALLKTAEKGDLVLLLLSGGASALMPAPVEGVSLGDKQRVTRLLLKRSATIGEINAVRKQLSRLKGGGFARLAAPARVIALALSDVPGDEPSTIGSGPAVVGGRKPEDAGRVLSRFLKRGELRPGVWSALRRKQLGAENVRAATWIIGSGRTFAEAARRRAEALGFSVRIREGALHGPARACGPAIVTHFSGLTGRRPLCVIATGETVVEVKGRGTGGRNQELALSAIPTLARLGTPSVLAAFATDGQDGPTTASGGLVDDQSLREALSRGISIEGSLSRNDSNAALSRLDALLVTGPTGTNVADIAVILR